MSHSRRQMGGRPGDNGFALLIVLWALVPLSLLFVALAGAARSDAQLTGNIRGAAELEAVADGAIDTAIFQLLQRGGPARERQSLVLRLSGIDVGVDIVSQSGLVNPNVVSASLLSALLQRVGTDPAQASALARAIVDWRSPGQGAGRSGAKSAAYKAAGLGYGPPGAPVESLGELGDVVGMTPAVLNALLPHLSLYTDRDPDPGVADAVVRAALRDAGANGRAGDASSDVVRITASVGRPGGPRVVRRGIVRIGASANRRGWRVLAWDTVSDG